LLQCSQTQEDVKKKAHRFIVTMAARQGISGQFAQYGNDTKRTFISSTPPSMIGHAWLFNMNTTCSEDIMELSGDCITNPDLRSFFFKGESKENCEEWTTLRDEREALQEVTDTFPLQLANMSNMIKEAEAKAEENEVESFRIRSSVEVGRQQILKLVREGIEGVTNVTATTDLDQNTNNNHRAEASTVHLRQHQCEALAQLDMLQRDQSKRMKWMGGASESVSILVELLRTISGEHLQTSLEKEDMERQLNLKSHHSNSDYKKMEQRFKHQERYFTQQENIMKNCSNELEAAIKKLKKENSDLSSMLQSSQMELKIHFKKTKGKILTLQEYKKILKKGVIDLRATLEEVKSESDVMSHQKAQLEGKLKKEKTRRLGLQKNYKVLRDQVTVQERVLGMMQSSIAGGGVVMNGNGSVMGDQSVHMDDSVVDGAGVTSNKVSIPPGPRDSTQNTRGALNIGVSSVGFHPRDVVVKLKVKGDNDDGSKGSCGSCPEKSLADDADDDDSNNSSFGDGQHSEEKQKTDGGEKSGLAHPPRHPNSNLRPFKHELRMSRSDMSVMREITTDRENATPAYDDGLHHHLGQDSTDRSKPTNTIVIDSAIVLQDGIFDEYDDSDPPVAQAGLTKVTSAPILKTKKRHPLLLETIPSLGDDSEATHAAQALSSTHGSADIRENSDAPTVHEDFGLVVKRKAKGDNDDGSKGIRGSCSGKSLADDDDSNNSSLGDGHSEEKQKTDGGEKSGLAHPPRHPNPCMSRSDMSVMSEITTDREIATPVHDDGLHHHLGQDSTDRSKPTNTIVIDSAIVLQDGNFDEYEDSDPPVTQAGLSKVTSAPTIKTKKRHPSLLETIPSLGDDSEATNAAQALSSTHDNDDIREHPGAPTVNEDFGLSGTGDEFTGDRGSHSSSVAVLASFAACGRLSPTDGGYPPISNVALGAAAEEKRERPQRKSQPQSLLPPVPPATKNEIKDHHRHLERPPTGAPNKPDTSDQTALLKKPTLGGLLNGNDGMSFSSTMSKMRKIDSTSSGGSVIFAENTAFSVIATMMTMRLLSPPE
jgi:hypothetical protein